VTGITGAVRPRRRLFVAVAVGVLLLNAALPPLVLSVVRKPWDHFSFNPWLRHLPAWLASDEATWGRKVEFLWGAALYWFIASGSYDAADWGYTATFRDVVRWVALALLFATYFALWYARRDRMRACALPPAHPAPVGGEGAGLAGALLSTLGFSTLPCSVVGCGAPVLPVLGLALSGLELSSETLKAISRTSQAITLLVYAGVILGIGLLARPVFGPAAIPARGPVIDAASGEAPGPA